MADMVQITDDNFDDVPGPVAVRRVHRLDRFLQLLGLPLFVDLMIVQVLGHRCAGRGV